MVLTCRREVEGRHCLTFQKMKKHVRPSLKMIEKGKSKKTCKSGFVFTLWKPLQSIRLTNYRLAHESDIMQGQYYATGNLAKTYQYEDRGFEKNHALARFFRTTYSDALLNPVVHLIIITAFLSYLVRV